ncbi:MAG: MFS transporter, partial [Pseudomonadota bacterium]|nr:MFS transporter [Pseudomonadota bacterium]
MTAEGARTSLAPPIWVLAMAVSAANVGITVLSPAIPQMRDDLMATSDEAQLVLSAFLIMLGVGQLIAGSLSDRIGRRPVLVYGSLLFVLSGLGALFSTSIEMLVAMRIFQGLGAATCMAMGRVIISDSFQRAEAGRQMSTITMFQ